MQPPLIDEDHITQAVIARHAGVADARLRDVMTTLVQHLHAFMRDVRLTEAEWHAGLRFLAEAGGASARSPFASEAAANGELARLAQALGASALVAALNRRGLPAAEARTASRPDGAALPPAPGEGPLARLLRALGREA